MLYGASRVASRNSVFLASLVLLFVISFSVPLIFTFKISGIYSPGSSSQDADAVFPGYTAISALGEHLEIEGGTDLNPQPGNDYIVSGWFRLSRMPQLKEKVLLLSKVDGQAENSAGFVLGLARDTDTIRPIVYWGDGDVGRWYSFSDIGLASQSWFMLALSFQEGKFLGLHLGVPVPNRDTEVRLLGGYEVENGVVPDPVSPLRVGAWNEGRFRGRLGPFGVLSPSSIGDELKDLVKELARNPLTPPPSIAAKDVKIWVAERGKDISGYKRPVQLVRGSPRRRNS